MRSIILTFFLIFPSDLVGSEANALQEAQINFLLNEIEKSDIVFMRNGDEHNGKKARKHLENKMNYARRAFWLFGPKIDITVENFIEKIASRSSSSDKEYQVRLKTGVVMSTNQWLRQKLKEFNKTHERPLKK